MDGRKIVLFPVILDLELISDVSDIYKPLWSESFVKSRVMSEKNYNFIQLVEFGESFTVAGTDSGILYSWGNNEFNQLGRKTDMDIEALSSVAAINLDPDWKQPQKVIDFLLLEL
jgi:alpha-tubulin suppressor-like RCC1 family protein